MVFSSLSLLPSFRSSPFSFFLFSLAFPTLNSELCHDYVLNVIGQYIKIENKKKDRKVWGSASGVANQGKIPPKVKGRAQEKNLPELETILKPKEKLTQFMHTRICIRKII